MAESSKIWRSMSSGKQASVVGGMVGIDAEQQLLLLTQIVSDTVTLEP